MFERRKGLLDKYYLQDVLSIGFPVVSTGSICQLLLIGEKSSQRNMALTIFDHYLKIIICEYFAHISNDFTIDFSK